MSRLATVRCGVNGRVSLRAVPGQWASSALYTSSRNCVHREEGSTYANNVRSEKLPNPFTVHEKGVMCDARHEAAASDAAAVTSLSEKPAASRNGGTSVIWNGVVKPLLHPYTLPMYSRHGRSLRERSSGTRTPMK